MCDGGSKDNTVQKVKDFSQRVNVPVKVTHSQPGGFSIFKQSYMYNCSLLSS